MEIDSDEFWTPEQLEKICQLYETGDYDRMRFFCRFFVGEKIIITSENFYGAKPGEWSRSWFFKVGMMQLKHEPPILQGCGTRELSRDETRRLGLVFDHEAYKYEWQLKFKEIYYKYPNATAHWRRLQANTQWPVELKNFLPWVGDGATADIIK